MVAATGGQRPPLTPWKASHPPPEPGPSGREHLVLAFSHRLPAGWEDSSPLRSPRGAAVGGERGNLHGPTVATQSRLPLEGSRGSEEVGETSLGRRFWCLGATVESLSLSLSLGQSALAEEAVSFQSQTLVSGTHLDLLCRTAGGVWMTSGCCCACSMHQQCCSVCRLHSMNHGSDQGRFLGAKECLAHDEAAQLSAVHQTASCIREPESS